MSRNAERKYVNLRRRLDQLGYRQPLAIESLPLVEKLFSDLVHTTESLRNAKQSAGKLDQESQNADALLEPFRAENARLVRENNDLHLQLLRLKEDNDRVTKELKTHIRQLDHEASDLKFLNNQYAHKVRCLEKDTKAKADRILQLQEKNLQAVVQTPGGKKHSIPFRRQRMQIDELVPPPSTSSYPVSQPDNPYVADLLLLADGRIVELQEDILKLKLDLERAQDCINHRDNQVEEREKEIERLNRALHGGRPQDVISLEAQNLNNEKMIAHLNLQMGYLQETNSTLEKQIEKLQQKKRNSFSEVADLSLKNMELCEELTQIDHLAKKLEIDKERALQMADVELQQAKREIKQQQKSIEGLEDVITNMRKRQKDHDAERDQLRVQLSQLKEQNEKMEGLIDFQEEEKGRLQGKMEKMIIAEKNLVQEVEAMRLKHGLCGCQRSPSHVKAFSPKDERNHFRKESEHYKQTGETDGQDSSPSHSPRKGKSPGSRGGKAASSSPDLLRVLTERDKLRSALKALEEDMVQLQSTARALSAERDQYRDLLQQAQRGQNNSVVFAELSQLTADFREAENKIMLLTAERDSLLEQLKVAQIPGYNEREGGELRSRENIIRRYEQEILDLQMHVDLLKEGKEAVELELEVKSTALMQNAEEMAQLKAESSALRLLQDQMQHSLSDTQHRLSMKMNELHGANNQIEKLEEKIGEMSQLVSRHRQDGAVLQKSVSVLDREKDALQDDVDQKTESLVHLQEELKEKEKTLEDVRLTVTNLDTALSQLQGALNSRERELTSLRRQLDSCQEDLSRHRRDKDVTLRENRRLQDDLATMTRENQALHAEMEQVLHEKDELKRKVHAYISEVSKVEQLMATKEQENRDLLDRFRIAQCEMEERQQKILKSEDFTNSVRMELHASDSERRLLRETVSKQETDIQHHVEALQAYETQVSSLVRGMSRLEQDLEKARVEKTTLLDDLASVRELCVKLDSGKDMTARQLTAKSMELERMTGELEDVRSETELLKKQLASERLSVRNLETLLSSNRQKEFQSHLTAAEKESELKLLQDRLALANSKIAEHERDASSLRSQVSQLETEMDVMKRQLISERFERERTVQEMRKQGASISSSLNMSADPQDVSANQPNPQPQVRSREKSSDKSVSFMDE
ncbi:centrosomal protein of 135 kDa [Synchiropus splendidus]|uniref:centrosomal protein of 135 kDa n=1 Tax=Synchiropus splendidus TaxID=270530 RepID=UPI00237ED6DC|nr:centrosomal protein of 135 kDa [Synchiropus splendidus]